MLSPNSERLQKFLAAQGIASRRNIERWITEGKITVNGVVARLGQKVTPNCRIKIEDRLVRYQSPEKVKKQQRVLLYNKPEGEICTRSDPKKRPTVFKNLPKLKHQRWVAVGRLDINTRGLMLFTNDGGLANHLMHPKLEIEREYMCRVFGEVDKNTIEQLQKGFELDGQLVRFHTIRRQRGEGSNSWFSVTVKEGKYREVRRLWQAVDCQLSRLSRIRYGKVSLPRGLKLGDWVELTPDYIERLSSNREKDSAIPPKLPKKSDRKKKFR